MEITSKVNYNELIRELEARDDIICQRAAHAIASLQSLVDEYRKYDSLIHVHTNPEDSIRGVTYED